MHREPHPCLRGKLVVVIDCSSLERSAHFWAAALGYVRDGDPAGRYQSLLPVGGMGSEVLLQKVPGGKHGRNLCTSICAPATLTPRPADSPPSALAR
jgi:hypothetical protein